MGKRVCGSHLEESFSAYTQTELDADPRLPRPGSDVYVPSAFYVTHGVDDFLGGLAKVEQVFNCLPTGEAYVCIAERPGCVYNWQFLQRAQAQLRQQFADNRAHLDPDYNPDYTPEFNRVG